MQRALGAKNKPRFIDGSLEIPTLQDLNRSRWEMCNHLIHSWLINYVSDQIASTIVFHDNAIDVWRDLHERFSKTDRIRITTLRTSINTLKQGSKYVHDYFMELKALWEELNSHRPILMCACVHQCRCAAMQLVRNYRLEDQIIQFLTGLNDSFSVVKTQVLLMDPLPTLNKVYSLVIQEESSHRSLPVLDDSPSLINAAHRSDHKGKGFAQNSGSKNSNRVCTFCHLTGHTVEFCYQKHAHPTFNKGKNSVNASHNDGNSPSVSNGATEGGSSSTPSPMIS
ncbi:integrase catalytic region [Trifolium medium]|uniref:Integrase catalytic region n=1 Tax=Trifolium medium TaxID=97028 RepID=A0A392NGN2_9FABA|nr:integrase catalytic region [Trifolium medium]